MAEGKRYRNATQKYDRERAHPAPEALELVRSLATAKFDETVDVVFKLGIDLVPVLDKGRAVGVVLMTDVFDLVAEFLAENAGG